MAADGHLLLVLHAPPKPDDTERAGRFFWRNPQGEWLSKDLGSGIRALGLHIDEFEELINKLDREEAQASTVDEYFRVLEQLAPVHRTVRNLYQVLQEARRCARTIARSSTCGTVPTDWNAMRNCCSRKRRTRSISGWPNNRKSQSRATERMVVAQHRLNMLVAFFFPIATLDDDFRRQSAARFRRPLRTEPVYRHDCRRPGAGPAAHAVCHVARPTIAVRDGHIAELNPAGNLREWARVGCGANGQATSFPLKENQHETQVFS